MNSGLAGTWTVVLVLVCVIGLSSIDMSTVSAADWPQFMRNPAHTGDAADEELQLPLGLVAQVRLDDAVMTSPAVVGERAYVVDQMGAAYCIDVLAGRIVWKASPDVSGAMGSNTSSPCVAQGRVCFGTTAGNLHILDARDGKVVRTLNVGSPILSSPTFANGSVYFQTLDAVLWCVDLNGNERWKWDHYVRFQESAETAKALAPLRAPASVDGMYGTPNYGGGEVAVSGKKVVTSFGWDIVCLEDTAAEAKLLWCNRAPTGGNGTAPMSSSISGDWIYAAGMGADGVMGMTRLSLSDGQVSKTSGDIKNYAPKLEAGPWSTPAVRGTVAAGREFQGGWYSKNGIAFYDFATSKTLLKWRDDTDATPMVTSHALAKERLISTTLRGEVLVFDLAAKPGVAPFRFRTPNGKGIGSSPAVSGGRIYFGCDDGCFYVLGPDGELRPTVDDQLMIHEPRATIQSATARTYNWPTTCGNAANTSLVDDPDLKPPLRVRWATRSFGHYKAPCIVYEGDVVSVTLQGLVTCQEQATGRTRWRVALPGPESWTGAGLLADAGRLFVPRPVYGRPDGVLHCLDLRTGRILWSADIGGRHVWARSSPVVASDLVAFGSTGPNSNGPPGATIKAWRVETGEPAWQVDLNVHSNRVGDIGGCTDGKVMYFTAGVGDYKLTEGEKKGGEAVAIEAKTGKVLWRSTDPFGSTYPVLAGDRLLLNEYFGDLSCVRAADGKPIWKRKTGGYDQFSVGADFLVMRGYGGHGAKVRLADGKDYPGCEELGGETHACGAVALTPNYSFAITLAGLNVREVKTGKLLWHSPGFAPRACVNPTLANGRVFWTSGASGMIYCWEPAPPVLPVRAEIHTESFDREPANWEGFNNRSTHFAPQSVTQDFGYSAATDHAGGQPGELGGRINPAGEAAYYGYRLPKPLTLDDPIAASGRIVVPHGPGHFLLGFFNSGTLNEWRSPNTLVARINGRGDGFHCHVEYCTSRWRCDAGVVGKIVPGRRVEAAEIPCSRVYEWQLAYDPEAAGGNGLLVFALDGKTTRCSIVKEHRADGATLTHFGLLPVLKSWDGAGEVWIDDVTVLGKRFDFEADPKWDALNNRRTYVTENIRPRFDFGWSPTHLAGGKAAGELGGLIFRGDCREPHRMAAYGARLSTLTLDTPLFARGKVSMIRGVTDSTASIGFYHSTWSLHSNPAQNQSIPMDYLGINIEGPSAEGFFFYPVCRVHGHLAKALDGRAGKAPRIYPDRKTHDWTLKYDPAGAGGRGRITVSLDGQTGTLDLEPGAKAIGASFDRFGICTPWIDGNSVTVYFDDLQYTGGPTPPGR